MPKDKPAVKKEILIDRDDQNRNIFIGWNYNKERLHSEELTFDNCTLVLDRGIITGKVLGVEITYGE